MNLLSGSGASMNRSIEWHDPAKDPAVIQLAQSVALRARWAQPDVLVEGNQLLAEIAQVAPLFQERIYYLAQKATQELGIQVELVVGGVKVLGAGAFQSMAAGPPDLVATRASRDLAQRAALTRQILEAAEQVSTASNAHRRQVDAVRMAAVDAAHYLNVIFRQVHRFEAEFTFTVPHVLEVDDNVYEIGLTRVHEALNTETTSMADERGVA